MLFKKAVLIIHGFAGGTYDQEELANYLQLNKNFDVFQFTLPGHKRNLSKVEYEEWIIESEKQLNWLINNGYNSIYLIGHSMGGVIATYLASKYSEIKKLVLAAPAFHYLNITNDNVNITESLKLAPKVVKDYGSDEVIGRMLKLNISVLKEFMELVKNYYNYPSEVGCPTLILQGKNDNLVPLTSSEYVYNSIKSKTKKLIYINNSNHELFNSANKIRIFNIIEYFLRYNIKGGIDTI